MSEKTIGRVGRDELSAIAHTAALTIMGRTGKWSVCLDPEGRVTVENPAHVIPDDWLGTWDQQFGHFGVWREIEDELKDAVAARGISGELKYRTRVYAGRVSARRAA